MSTWPAPEGFVPPRALEALDAALAGDLARATARVTSAEARDPFAAPVLRLVRALVALQNDDARARADLRALSRHGDVAIAWFATLARVEEALAARRFAHAAQPLGRIRARTRDAALRLWIDATALRIELLRRGTLSRNLADALESRLDRSHPPVVHAAVHVLRAERGLLTGELPAAVAGHRDARPYVRASGNAALVRREEELTRLLRAPFVDVDDWEEPLRTLSREELAAVEVRDWQVWVDVLHRRVARQTRGTVQALAFARWPELWMALEALVRSPGRRLTWAAAVAPLGVANAAAARERVRRLAAELKTIGVVLTQTDEGFALRDARFVCVVPTARLAPSALRLLGLLATGPAASASDLRGSTPHRTVSEHLHRLRQGGYVRLVGGGRDARYTLI